MQVKNIKLISEILNLDNDTELKSSDSLDDYDWDSMAIVLVQSHFSDHNGMEIEPDDLEELETLGDLDNYLNKYL